MKRYIYTYTYPVEDHELEEWEEETGTFRCEAENRSKADELFDKYCENEHNDATWDFDEIKVKHVDEKDLGEPEDPRQLRFFEKGEEKPYQDPKVERIGNQLTVKI